MQCPGGSCRVNGMCDVISVEIRELFRREFLSIRTSRVHATRQRQTIPNETGYTVYEKLTFATIRETQR